jgi:hypothetical protein
VTRVEDSPLSLYLSPGGRRVIPRLASTASIDPYLLGFFRFARNVAASL